MPHDRRFEGLEQVGFFNGTSNIFRHSFPLVWWGLSSKVSKSELVKMEALASEVTTSFVVL
jgi:hypothetical protein